MRDDRKRDDRMMMCSRWGRILCGSAFGMRDDDGRLGGCVVGTNDGYYSM